MDGEGVGLGDGDGLGVGIEVGSDAKWTEIKACDKANAASEETGVTSG